MEVTELSTVVAAVGQASATASPINLIPSNAGVSERVSESESDSAIESESDPVLEPEPELESEPESEPEMGTELEL